MKCPNRYKFRIDAHSPETFPMAKLAEYMADLAALLGSQDYVHFSHLEVGSTALVQNVEPEVAATVEDRLAQVRRLVAPPDAMKAFESLDNLLARDKAVGLLIADDGDGGAEILRFPGRERPKPVVYGAFNQEGSLEGVVIRVGGKDETVPIWLLDGLTQYNCTTNVDVSRALAPYYRNGIIRVYGTGRWHREENAQWVLERFVIRSFQPLDDAPLAEIVERMRAVADNGWRSFDDPLVELEKLRHDEGDGRTH